MAVGSQLAACRRITWREETEKNEDSDPVVDPDLAEEADLSALAVCQKRITLHDLSKK